MKKLKRSEREKGDGIERNAPWITILLVLAQVLRGEKKLRLSNIMEFLPRRRIYKLYKEYYLEAVAVKIAAGAQ